MDIDSSRGFVAFPRGLTDWEWYDDPNTSRLYFHFLLTANWQAKPWQGIIIQPGQLVTSLAQLSRQLKLSVMQVRTALKHLESTGYITLKTGPKYSLVTINNYDAITHPDKQASKQTANEQQADNNNLTITTNQQGNNSSSTVPEKTNQTKTTNAVLKAYQTSIGRLNANGRAELAEYSERLGEELVCEVIRKCGDTGGRSWAYVRKALLEAETQGIQSAAEYRLTHPIGAGHNQRVDRQTPSGNDFLRNTSLAASLERLKKPSQSASRPALPEGEPHGVRASLSTG